jgi:hypothetical protein
MRAVLQTASIAGHGGGRYHGSSRPDGVRRSSSPRRERRALWVIRILRIVHLSSLWSGEREPVGRVAS